LALPTAELVGATKRMTNNKDQSKEQPPVCDYEGSDYQSSFWDKGTRDYEDMVEAVALKRLLPPAGGELILEVGAGAGRNTPRYKEFKRIVVMDYSVTQLEQAQERLGTDSKYIYVAADVYRLPFVTGLFDSATMIRVLHHMADAPASLKEIRRTMMPGAAFILEYANKKNLKSILRHMFKKQDWSPYTTKPIEFVELNFNFHPKMIQKTLIDIGFAVRRHLTVSHFRIGFIKRLFPTKFLVWLDSIFQYTAPVLKVSPSIFVLSYADGNTTIAKRDDFFSCPDCQDALVDTKEKGYLVCKCGSKWEYKNGIYNFKQPLS
jgi:ubiquinone/menaquinone biosynthesis C-methylase UbiE